MSKNTLSDDIKKELSDSSKLKDEEIKTKLDATKTTEIAGIVDEKGIFDLKKFTNTLDNQGRRDVLIDALKSRDKQKESTLESRILLESKVKKLKETMELQKRYYQLVPRAKINNGFVVKYEPIGGVDKNTLTALETYNGSTINILITPVPRKDERAGDVSRLSPSGLASIITTPSSTVKDMIMSESTDISNYPYIFVNIKPVESNLSLELSREKFQGNLQKIKIGYDKERESEAIREYGKLSSQTMVDPSTEKNRKDELIKQLQSSFGTEYADIIQKFHTKIDDYISKSSSIICIRSSDLDISRITIRDFKDIPWSDGLSTDEHYENLLRTMNVDGPNFQPVDGSVFNTQSFIRYTTRLRDRDSLFSGDRYGSATRSLSIINMINNVVSLIDNSIVANISATNLNVPQGMSEPDYRLSLIRDNQAPYTDAIWSNVRRALSNTDKDTKDWIEFINNEKKKLKDDLTDIRRDIEKEYDSRLKTTLKATAQDKEKIAISPCRLLMGDLYVTTMYGKKYFDGYNKYVSKNTPDKIYAFTQNKIVPNAIYYIGTNTNLRHWWEQYRQMLLNRIEAFPNEYKLFPQDIQFICYCLSIKWSPFIDIRKLIDYLITEIDNMDHDRNYDQTTTKDIRNYYDNIDPMCYEYIEKVSPIFSVNCTYYEPKTPITTSPPIGRVIIFDTSTIEGQVHMFISSDNVSVARVYNNDGLTNVRLPLTNKSTLNSVFYNAIKNVAIPELKLTLNTFGIEGLVNITNNYQEAFWTKITNINQINYNRENTAFYYIEEKIETEKLANEFYDKQERLKEMESVVENMNKIIKDRDSGKLKTDTLTQQLELGLEAFQFWKDSGDSKNEVYNILNEYRISKYFSLLDKKNFATVSKFLQLEDSTLFDSITKDFDMTQEDIVLMKKAISTLKERIEKSKKSLEETKEKTTDDTLSAEKLSQKLQDSIPQFATDAEIIDFQKSEIQKDMDELKDDEQKIKLLQTEHELILKRNLQLDKLYRDTQTKLLKHKSHNIEIDEHMQNKINDIIRNYQKEYQRNLQSAEELFEIITTMKNIFSTKKTKLLMSQNRQLKQSLDEAYHIIQSHENKQLEQKLTYKKKDLEHLHKKRTKKKYKKSTTNELPPIYRVLTPKKK